MPTWRAVTFFFFQADRCFESDYTCKLLIAFVLTDAFSRSSSFADISWELSHHLPRLHLCAERNILNYFHTFDHSHISMYSRSGFRLIDRGSCLTVRSFSAGQLLVRRHGRADNASDSPSLRVAAWDLDIARFLSFPSFCVASTLTWQPAVRPKPMVFIVNWVYTVEVHVATSVRICLHEVERHTLTASI